VDRNVLSHGSMSSASQIAVATLYSPSADSRSPRELGSGERIRPADLPDDSAWQPALDAQPANSEGNALAHVWEDLVQGRLRTWYQTVTHDSIRLLAHFNGAHTPLCPDDAAVLLRVLCGDAQKVLAADLGVANSTVSGRCIRALTRLGLERRPVPLPLVLAAQSCAGIVRLPKVTSSHFDDDGRPCVALSVPRPITTNLGTLTRAEHEVARALMEGYTRSEIALRRTTSVFTVTRQFSAIFGALRVTGRYSLIRCAAERGCFS
jgi:DNA-binding NarL/FixJ family response regulator